MKSDKGVSCPCGSGRRHSECCEPFLIGAADAPTAEALMRSRYTAYVLGRLDYLRATWHPASCPSALRLVPDLQWMGLQIKRIEAGGPRDVHGVVEFVAVSKLGGRAERMHETSTFERVDGRWLYCRGDMHAR